jgi:hypothetical protein
VVLSWGHARHRKRRKASNFNTQSSARFANDEMTPINKPEFRRITGIESRLWILTRGI